MQISLKIVLNGLINKKRALVPIMAWHRTGDMPLFETILAYSSFAHIWVTLATRHFKKSTMKIREIYRHFDGPILFYVTLVLKGVI